MSRRTEILARLAQHPGLTEFELRRVLGYRSKLDRLLRDMHLAGQVIPVSAWRADQGRMVRYWHLAPDGTPPAPMSAAARDGKRRRDRESKRRSRARSRGGLHGTRVTLPRSVAVPPLRGAACAGEDPDLFFSDLAADIATAKQICTRCPVREACADAAEANGEQYGVWAGIDRASRTVVAA